MFDTAAIAAKSSSESPTRARMSRSAWTRSWALPIAKRRGMGRWYGRKGGRPASAPGRRPDAAELPVPAERGRENLLAGRRLGAVVRRNAERARHDVVLQATQSVDLDLHHVARLDRPGVGRGAGQQDVAGQQRDRAGDV